MLCVFTEINNLLNDIDNALKDEAEALAIHDEPLLQTSRERRRGYENMVLEMTPDDRRDIANLLIAISDMIERGDHPGLSSAVSAIGQRILREATLSGA